MMDESEEFLHYYDEEEIYQETIEDVWIYCVLPSLKSIYSIFFKIILVNLLFGYLTSTVKLPQTSFHLLSGFSGIYFLSNLESPEGKIIIFVFFTQFYLLLHIGSFIKNDYEVKESKCDTYKVGLLSNANVIKYCLIILLVLCEYFLLKSETWMEIRGVIMIFSMKLISLAEDVNNDVTIIPTFLQYFGYMFCGGNVMFGPWISFQEYIVLHHHPMKKNIWWIIGILKAVTLSVIFLVISNCAANYFISDDASVWFVAYKEALTFRTSHYFICYLSEASMLAAGFRNNKIWSEHQQWRYVLANPLKIEFPPALSVVVTNWNRPMHDFLKRYIYKSWLPLGKFYAVLATFIISSFLHGFELKVSVVLITIGILSYLEFAVRDYLAAAFDCCIRVYPCKKCTHKYGRDSATSRLYRLIFVSTSVIHLIYLGMLMDSNTDEIGIYEKWRGLYFVSFWIMVCNLLVVL